MLADKPKFFGRRKGRTIRKAKTNLLEVFLPHIKFMSMPDSSKTYLEIGFGDGQHLAGMAKKYPDINFIGAEVFKNGVANLLSLITGIKEGQVLPEHIELDAGRVDNIRVWDDDVRLLFAQIPDNSIDKVFLLFPDPWPKKRHADRRFINPENLAEIYRILKPVGSLLVATDHKVYKSWVLRQMNQNQNFMWTAKSSDDWRNPPCDWVPTKYQAKAIREGRKAVFFNYTVLKSVSF